MLKVRHARVAITGRSPRRRGPSRHEGPPGSGAVGGTVVQVEVVGLQHRRRDDGERALRLAAQPSLQPVLGVDVPEHK